MNWCKMIMLFLIRLKNNHLLSLINCMTASVNRGSMKSNFYSSIWPLITSFAGYCTCEIHHNIAFQQFFIDNRFIREKLFSTFYILRYWCHYLWWRLCWEPYRLSYAFPWNLCYWPCPCCPVSWRWYVIFLTT